MHAGAQMALDSRFLFGLNNNDLVTNFFGRGGPYPTQSNATYKPTYKTEQQGGNPVVSFNSDYMLESAGVAGTTSNWSMIACMKSYAWNGSSGGGTIISCAATSAFTNDIMIARTQTIEFFEIDNSANGSGQLNILSAGQQIKSVIYDGTQASNAERLKYFFNGASQTLTYNYTVPTSINPSGGYGVGVYKGAMSFEWWLLGDICLLTVFRTQINDSLRRRMEAAASLSFKMPCS
jgi:hypothetical protein